jgi:hypothetical protein
VDPTPLALGRGPHLTHRLPEARRPVADGQRRLDLQAPGPHIRQQLLPGLLALPVAVGHGDQLLAAVGGRPDQHQEALPVLVQADVEVHAVGPHVDVTLALQGALAPGAVLGLPGGLEPGHGGGGQPGGARAEQGH